MEYYTDREQFEKPLEILKATILAKFGEPKLGHRKNTLRDSRQLR